MIDHTLVRGVGLKATQQQRKCGRIEFYQLNLYLAITINYTIYIISIVKLSVFIHISVVYMCIEDMPC